jgi:hypothetical protein
MNKIKMGVFNVVSYNGFKFDLLKSGLQKYIRRGEFEKACFCLNEILLFKLSDDKKRVKGILTNLKNRLIIILNEDLSINNCDLYIKVDKLLEEWEKSDRENDDLLFQILYYLCDSKKMRLSSNLRGYFWSGLKDDRLKKYYEEDKVWERKNTYGKNFYKKDDDSLIKKYIDGFVYCLDNKYSDAYYWFFKILNSDKKSGRRNRKGKKCYIIMDILKDYYKNKNIDLYNIIEKWVINNNNSRDENWLYICNILSMLIFNDKMVWDKKVEDKDIKIDNEYYKNMNFIFDDYVMDMHVSDGKKNGKNELDFVKEGMIVFNRDDDFYIEKYDIVYKEYKLLNMNNKKIKKTKKVKKEKVEKVEKKVEEKSIKKKSKKNKDFRLEKDLTNIVFEDLFDIENINELNDMLCEKNVCGNKSMCFKKNGYVYKEMRKSFNYGRDCLVLDNVKFLFGIKNIGINRILSNKVVKRIDIKKKEWEDNMKIEEKENVVYLVMNEFKNKSSLSRNKELYNNEKVKREVLKIGIFRGIFRVSDFNYRNILVNDNNELLSIDENNIGDRDNIFWKGFNWKDFDKKMVDEVIDEIVKRKDMKKKVIKKEMEKFLFDEEIINNIMNNFDNIKNDVYKEFGYE